MSTRFSQRGYPPNVLFIEWDRTPSRILSSVTSKRIPFVHKYHPYAPKIAQTLKRHWKILGEAYPVYRNSSSHLSCVISKIKTYATTKADIVSFRQPTRQSFLATPCKGTLPCLNCAHCSSVSKGEYFTHTHTGKQYPINGFYTCNSDFVVYIIKCPCGHLYVGETTQRVKNRISKHKSTF